MEYSAIEDLPEAEELCALSSSELAALGELWKEKKGELEESGEYRNFIRKMQREWAIETGIIERLYAWDRGVTETLIEHGVDASIISHGGGVNRDDAENIVNMIEDQLNIVEGLFPFIKGELPFSEHFIRSLHEKFTAHQKYTEAMTSEDIIVKVALLKGTYKEQLNNPKRPDGSIHEYCPPELVTDEMERLVKLYLDYESEVAPEILSAWLHHRFTQIHPFQDGNGRIARAIASLVFLKAGLFPLVIRDSDREDYIKALEKADDNDLLPLVTLFAKRQRNSILAALGIQQQVAQAKHAQQIITIAVELLNKKSRIEKDQIESIYVVSAKLQKIVEEKISAIQGKLNPELRKIEPLNHETYNASVKFASNDDQERYYFRREIIKMAQMHDYFANSDHYKSWSRLNIYTGSIFEIVFSIHGHGHRDNGIMVVSGFTFERVPSEETKTGTSANIKSCNRDIFQFNYLESEENIFKRFDEWLDDSVTFALAEWQKSIA